MPHLRFDTDADPTAERKGTLAASVIDSYTDHMETTPGHVAVTVCDHDSADLYLGRAVEGPAVFLDADVRERRPFELRRAFALATTEYPIDECGVSEANLEVSSTEHAGDRTMGYDRVGGDWTEG